MNESVSTSLMLNKNALQRIIIAVVIVAFFSFADHSSYVYVIKVCAIVGLLVLSRRIKINLYLLWILCFSLFAFSSVFWAFDKGVAFFFLAWYLQAVLLAYVIGISIHDTSDVEYILKCIMIAGLILSVRALMGVSLSTIGSFRIGSNIGYNANELALKTALSSIVTYRYYKESSNRLYKVFYLLILLLLIVVVCFSGSRKAMILTFAVIFMYSVLLSSKPTKVLKNTFLVVVALFLLYYAMTQIEVFYNAFGRRFMLLFNLLGDNEYIGNSLSNRMDYIEVGIEAFKERPICGYGIGNFATATSKSGYAHNNYIQLVVDLGIIGLILYYSFYVTTGIQLFLARRRDGLSVMLLSMLVVILIVETGLVSYTSDYIHLSIMLCYCISHVNRSDLKKSTE